jgi:beta-1,2-xylosyltransferase
MDKKTPWIKAHRFRLHRFAQNQSTEMLSFNVPDIGSEKGPLKMRKEEGTVHDIARFFYDMKLAGSPLQCNETDGTCEDME